MSLNYREIDLILEELNLEGSRIDKINQPDRFSLYMETYSPEKKQKIIISLAHGSVRLNRITEKPELPDYPPRFSQLLRSRIRNGTILSVSQPSGERLILFRIICRGNKYNLWIRLWSGNPNILLTDENDLITDVFLRKPNLGEVQGKYFSPDFSGISKSTKIERPLREFDSAIGFNRFIEQQYNKNCQELNFTKRKEKSLNKISLKISRISSHIKKLDKRLHRYSGWESIRQKGELIQANLYRIKKGASSVIVEDYFNDNNRITLDLLPGLTPDQNSEFYFKKYKKYKQGFIISEAEISEQKKLLIVQQEKYNNIESCNNIEELSLYTDAETFEKKKIPESRIGLAFQSAGFIILVGRNSKENDQLLRKQVRGNDMWLHVRDYPGGYVFIKTPKGKSIPLETLLDGANLALLYSGKKYKTKADIHYTEVKNLRRVKGGKEGLVIPNNEKNLFIEYDNLRISRLQNKSILETMTIKKDN